jgi:hypothetical protein
VFRPEYFCELKHLNNNDNIESNEIIRIMAIEIIIKNSRILFLCDWIIAFNQRYTNIYNLKLKIMYKKQVLCKKV